MYVCASTNYIILALIYNFIISSVSFSFLLACFPLKGWLTVVFPLSSGSLCLFCEPYLLLLLCFPSSRQSDPFLTIGPPPFITFFDSFHLFKTLSSAVTLLSSPPLPSLCFYFVLSPPPPNCGCSVISFFLLLFLIYFLPLSSSAVCLFVFSSLFVPCWPEGCPPPTTLVPCTVNHFLL